MACKLYREGKGTVEHGIECESTTVELQYLDSMLNDGWSANPPGYEPPAPVDVEDQDGKGTHSDPVAEDAVDLQPEVDRLTAEVDQLNKLLELQCEIENNLTATIEHLKAVLAENGIEYAEEEEEDGELTNDEVRQAAKDKGIEGWDTRRIATLRAALEA